MGVMQRLAEIAGRKGYISARKTTRAAQRAGLSVCDYLEREWGAQGRTQGIVDRLAALGAFRDGARVVEIGTGTGRYLDLSLAYFKPSRVESYETDPGWARWLTKTYPVITSCETDGETLKATTTADLVQAHGVFVYLPFLVTCQYFREIWRVVAPGGMAVFDAFTEDCMGPEQVSAWLASPHRFPCILPRDYIVENFAANGFTLRDTFTATHTVGSPSRYFVFSRR